MLDTYVCVATAVNQCADVSTKKEKISVQMFLRPCIRFCCVSVHARVAELRVLDTIILLVGRSRIYRNS